MRHRLRSLVLLTVSLLALPLESSAAPKKFTVKNPAGIYGATTLDGSPVSCWNRDGSIVSGTASTRGKSKKLKHYFTPASGRLADISKKMKKARKKPAQLAALQAQYAALEAQIRSQDAACMVAVGIIPPEGYLPAHESLAPLGRPVTQNDVLNLLDKAGFGHDALGPNVSQAAHSQGVASAVHELMRYKDEYFGFEAFANDRLDEKRGVANLQNALTFRGQRQAWLNRALDTNNPFIYRLHECYLGLWTTGVNVLSERSSKTNLWQDYAEMLYRAAQNNDRIPDTLLRVGRHPLMLFYLSNNNNRKGSPNENYARELQELFSIGTNLIAPGSALNGIPNYVEFRVGPDGQNVQAQGDIRRIARRFTGHRAIEIADENGLKEYRWTYFEQDHEAGPELIYEGTPWAFWAESDEDVVKGIFNHHPAAANYLALQLLKCFHTEKPSPLLVASLGAELKRNDWRVWPTLAKLFQSEAFYSDYYRGTLTLSPYDIVVKQARVMGLSPLGRWDPLNPANEYGVNVADLESRLSNSNGYRLNLPDTVFWYFTDKFTSPGALLNLSNTLDRVMSYVTEQGRIGWTIRSAIPHDGMNSELVVRLTAPKLNIFITDDQLATLRFYLDNTANSNGTYTARPFEAQSVGTRDSKARTLATLMAMLPVNIIR